MEVKAEAKYLRISPRKVRRILDVIRKKKVLEVMNILKFLPQKGAEYVLRVVKSAVANAENNHKLNKDNLVISQAYVGPGPSLKRFRPGGRGRAFPILKRSAHIAIFVSSTEGK